MNANAAAPELREHRLRALGIPPLRLRGDNRGKAGAVVVLAADKKVAGRDAAASVAIRHLALQPDPVELRDPAIRKMYTALTEAVAKAGLKSIRVCDVAADPSAVVIVLGAAPAPDSVPEARVLHADPLCTLHADHQRKRVLWERMLALGQGGVG